MQIQGLSFERYLLAAGVVIALLFTVLAPSASLGFDLPGRFLYWTLHAFGALAALAAAQALLGRGVFWRRRPWLATIVAGALGAWLFAPFALGLEYGLGLVPEPDGDPLDAWAERFGILGALAAEAIELTPAVATTWLVLNMPWLLRLDFTPPTAPQEAAPAAGTEAATEPRESIALETASQEGATLEPAALEEIAEKKDAADTGHRTSVLDQLPAALGLDLVALSSQLHYLEAHTVRGRMLVLYNLRNAVDELQGTIGGLQIHRSHWVADAHVRRLAKRSSGWVCELTNGLELPVSRRRVAEAKQRWGAGATYRPTSDGAAIAPRGKPTSPGL